MGILKAVVMLFCLASGWAFAKPKEKSMENSKAIIEVVMKMSEAMRAGNLESVLKYYDPGASLVAQPGVTVDGAKFREAMQGYVSMKPKFDLPKHEVIESGDTALHIAPWTMEGVDPVTGQQMKQQGLSVAVLRRQKDGRWLILIDNPFGEYIKSK